MCSAPFHCSSVCSSFRSLPLSLFLTLFLSPSPAASLHHLWSSSLPLPHSLAASYCSAQLRPAEHSHFLLKSRKRNTDECLTGFCFAWKKSAEWQEVDRGTTKKAALWVTYYCRMKPNCISLLTQKRGQKWPPLRRQCFAGEGCANNLENNEWVPSE